MPDYMIEAALALLTLTLLEIVLGIDNLIFIAILSDRLPEAQQTTARRAGLGAALAMRILLLFTLSWFMGAQESLQAATAIGLPSSWWLVQQIDAFSWRDIILLVGGLFLIGKSVYEIHSNVEGHHEDDVSEVIHAGFAATLAQIAVMDIVFSLDSVITAVGMVKTEGENNEWGIYVMISAIVISIVVMMVFADWVSEFVNRHPTVKILALSFMILIGFMLVVESMESGEDGHHISKNYVYFAMGFAVFVELLNMRMRHTMREAAEEELPEERKPLTSETDVVADARDIEPTHPGEDA